MIEVILDASQLEAIERCPHLWFLDHHCNLTSVRTNPALSTGTFHHEINRFYYSADVKLRSDAFVETAKFAHSLSIATQMNDYFHKAGVRSIKWPAVNAEPKFHVDRSLAGLIKWREEDDTSEVIAVEKGFSTLLYEDSTRRYILEGMIDLVSIEKRMGLTVTDHKTQSRFYDKYEYNHQALNYLSFTGAEYFRYNYIGLQDNVGANTFRREIWKPAPGMINQWRKDVFGTFDEVYNILKEVETYKNIAGVNVAGLKIENMGSAFRRRRHGCQGQFGICQFHKLCEVPDGSKWKPVVLTAYKQKEQVWKAWS